MTKKYLPLPPAKMRWGGSQSDNDDFFTQSAVSSVNQLKASCGLKASSRLLDIGCGPGRILIGVDRTLGAIKRYIGIDVHEPSIKWCKKNLESNCEYASFQHVAIQNERYNPKGKDAGNSFTIKEEFDIAYLSSVFTHMSLLDVEHYLIEMRKFISKTGYIYCTAFVEQNVPIETENPKNYITEWVGPLHCVRFNRFFFEDMILRAGFHVESYQHKLQGHSQTHYILRPKENEYTTDLVH